MINILLSIISGFLTGLSFNSANFSFFIWFSIVPFLCVIEKTSLRKGILSSLFFGFVYSLTAIFWVSNVTTLGLILLLFYLSFYPVLFFLTGRYFIKKPFAVITLPALWVMLEFLRENIWCGFGWLNLGYSQYKNLLLIQPVDIFGVKFISFIIVMVNVLLWEIYRRKQFLIRKIIFIFLILSIIFSYGLIKLYSLKSKSSINLSIIQPNVPEEIKLEESSRGDMIEKLKRLVQDTKNDSLLVFPEAAWPPTLSDYNFYELKAFIKEIRKPSLMGAVKVENDNFFNSAMLFDDRGELLGIYRKIKIVPFGEYVPLRSAFNFIDAINSIGDMSRGIEQKIFSYDDKKFGVLICFEDVFPFFVSSFAKKSDFLINITNDGWFGGNPQASQHLAIMTIRAIENRISIARCANTGISGWVSYKGDIHCLKTAGEEVMSEGVLNFILPLNEKRSLYNKWGEVFVAICLILVMAAVIIFKFK